MKTKPRSGPWSVKLDPPWGIVIHPIEFMHSWDGDESDDAKAQIHAHAQLMSAAPELLEASRAAIDTVQRLLSGIREVDPQMAFTLQVSLDELISKLTAAINKAEGK